MALILEYEGAEVIGATAADYGFILDHARQLPRADQARFLTWLTGNSQRGIRRFGPDVIETIVSEVCEMAAGVVDAAPHAAAAALVEAAEIVQRRDCVHLGYDLTRAARRPTAFPSAFEQSPPQMGGGDGFPGAVWSHFKSDAQ